MSSNNIPQLNKVIFNLSEAKIIIKKIIKKNKNDSELKILNSALDEVDASISNVLKLYATQIPDNK